MGQADIAQKQFFEDNERFADLLNGVLFQGETIIRSEDLAEKNPVSNATQKERAGKRGRIVEKYRDIIRKVFFGVNFCLIGVENQTKTHYAMPVRTMLMDALGYEEQIRKYKRAGRRGGQKSGAEYLSGFSKKDRLKPCCTITVYYGEEPWDGAGNLRELLDLTGVPERLVKYFGDYPIHLVDVHRLEGLDCFHTDLKSVFGLIQNASDGQRLKQYVEEHEEELQDMREDAYEFALTATNSPELRRIKEHIITEEGRCDMCKGLRELMRDSKEEGKTEGVNEMQRLVFLLLNENRMEELRRAAEDTKYRDELLAEYSMQKMG